MIRTLVFLFALICAVSSSGQGFLKKLKNTVETQLSKPAASGLADGRMEKARLEQLVKDTSNYNYIFSQGNRASFFANREGKENLLLKIGKNYEDEEVGIEAVELEIHEQVFDLNRSGEISIYVKPWLASVNFLEALSLMSSELAFLNITNLDTAFSIEGLVDMDTLSVPEKYALGKTMANFSILINGQGKIELSQDFVDETTRYFKEHIGESSIALASLYNNHAVIVQSQGRYIEAEEYFVKSEDILVNNEKSGSLAHAILTSNRALLQNEIGQFEEARTSIKKAQELASGEIREKGRDNTSFKINEGLIEFSAGNYERSEQIFREVLELKRKRMAKNQTDYANVENYLAGVLMESGKTAEVQEFLNDALRIFESKYDTSHPAYIKTKHNLGRFKLYVGDFEGASAVLQEVSAAYLQFFGENHPDYLSSLEDQAVVSWKLGLFSTANQLFAQTIDANLVLVEKYFGAMSEYEKGQYWAKVRPSILKFYSYATERGAEDPELLTRMFNLHLKTKGILLSASTKVREQILQSEDEELKAVYSEWVETKESLILYYSFSKEQLAKQSVDIASVEAEANRLEKELSKMSAEFAESNKLPTTTLAEVKSKLEANDAAVEIVGHSVFDKSFTKEKNYAFLIARSSSVHPTLVVIEKGQDLDQKYAKAYRNMVQLKANDQITYSKFWKPVDEKLKGIANLYMSLDGIYYQVNIGALKRPDNSFVSDAMNLHLYSSTRDLVKSGVASTSTKKADFFGFPDYGSKGLLDALPGTRDEIAAVSTISKSKGFVTSTYLAKEASEENFKKLSSPSLLHIATHGFFLPESQSTGEKVFGIDVNQANDNPLLRSGLMLADAEQTMDVATQGTEVSTSNNGVLTAYEVMTLDLKNTDLVVLSACETGLGEIKSGEGVYGLQRAFQLAGAETVVMSLWKVSDEATKQLMTSFYKEWMGGKKKEDAFFAAQKSLRENFPEPYYWGAFVMLN